MLFFDHAQQRLFAAIIALGAKAATAAELRAVLDAGKAAKPLDYDVDVAGMAQRYRGDQQAIIAAKLLDRYPNAGKMPISPVNWLAFFARSDAGVYVVDAERYLETLAKEDIPADDARALAFARALEDMGLATLMPELERRTLTGVKAAAVEIMWRKVDDADEGKPVGFMYWPSDIFVICHPSAPNDERAIMVCGLRQTPTSAAPGVHTWMIYSRSFEANPDGSVKAWGDWMWVRTRSDGEHPALPAKYPGKRLPVAFLRIEQADGGFWPCPEKDTIAQIDELNVGRSNEQHTVDLQGHGQGVYFGTLLEGDHLPMGPDRWVKAEPSARIESVNFNPLLEDMRASRSQSLREVAVSRSNNPDAYATTPTVAVSGVSRSIANLPHDKRVRELRPIFRRFEEQQLLPILLEVLEQFAPTSYAPKFGDVVPRVVFGVPPDYEELDSKQRRLELDLKLGVISKARYAVLMGHYDNERDAAADGLALELEKPKPPSAFGLPPAPGLPQLPAKPDLSEGDGVAHDNAEDTKPAEGGGST